MGIINKTTQQLNDIVKFFIGTPEGDDRGIRIVNAQLTVEDDEFIVGKDSYPVPYAFQCDMSNTSGLTITDAIDVSAILQSDTGSATGLFNGVTTGKYLLVGSPQKFSGVKVKTTTNGVIGDYDYEVEIIKNSTPIYSRANVMCTNADEIFTSYGRQLTQFPKEHWRFGANPLETPVEWELTTININGSDYTAYWGRIRLVNDITQDAVIEQIKCHTDRIEIEKGIEFFGYSRYKKTIFSGFKNTVHNYLKNPANENIKYGVDTTGVYVENELKNGADDGFIVEFSIESWLDTSVPIVFQVDGYSKSNNAGTVKFGVDIFHIHEGFTFEGTKTPDLTYTATDTFPAGEKNKLRHARFEIPIESLLPGEKVVMSFYRMGNDPEDTLDNSAVIENIYCEGYGWKI